MSNTYKGVLRNVYYAPRKIIVAQGRRLEFIEGVATGIPEYTAKLLQRQNILSEITPEFEVEAPVLAEEQVTVAPVVEEVVEEEVVEEAVEEAVAEEAVEELTEEVAEEEPIVEEEEIPAEEEPSMEFEPVEGNEETSDGLLTRSEVQEMYERLGTWTAVAEDLDVSTTTLKKYRDELGL